MVSTQLCHRSSDFSDPGPANSLTTVLRRRKLCKQSFGLHSCTHTLNILLHIMLPFKSARVLLSLGQAWNKMAMRWTSLPLQLTIPESQMFESFQRDSTQLEMQNVQERSELYSCIWCHTSKVCVPAVFFP